MQYDKITEHFSSGLVSRLKYMVLHKKHPFSFFHNSVKWQSICTKFLPGVSKEILIQTMWTKYGC